jgi:hypothetical protein
MQPKRFSSFSNPLQNVIQEKGFLTPTESDGTITILLERQ